jgi:hypothetical protein
MIGHVITLVVGMAMGAAALALVALRLVGDDQ